jgi:26S proteasome regulatory subunit N7
MTHIACCSFSCRPDAKNALYLETIKRGDLLLNRVQKLSRVIDVD